MKNRFSKGLLFAGKSLVWAAAMYSLCMVAMYRDDIASGVSSNTAMLMRHAHVAVPRVNDTTVIIPAIHTGIVLSLPHGIQSIEVNVDRLMFLFHLLGK